MAITNHVAILSGFQQVKKELLPNKLKCKELVFDNTPNSKFILLKCYNESLKKIYESSA